MNLYEEGQDGESGEDVVISMSYEEYLLRKEELQIIIENADAAKKLSTIPEFQLVVMEGYFTQEPQRLAALMASGKIAEKSFDNCAKDLRSIAHLRSFLTEQLERGEVARGELESLEEAYEEAVASGAMNTNLMI